MTTDEIISRSRLLENEIKVSFKLFKLGGLHYPDNISLVLVRRA